MVVHYPRTVRKKSYAEHEVTGNVSTIWVHRPVSVILYVLCCRYTFKKYNIYNIGNLHKQFYLVDLQPSYLPVILASGTHVP